MSLLSRVHDEIWGYGMNTDVMFSRNSQDWETPQDFFNKLDLEFHFTLDPCASDFNHKCAKYYTKIDNGLTQCWENETVFCNPPYGKELSNWVQKCFEEVYCRKCPCAVLLIPARTDTKWFHSYINHKAEIRFIRGRLKFGNSKNSAPFPSMLVIYKKDAN